MTPWRIVTLGLCILCIGPSFAQAGSHDPEWGTDGVVLTDFSSDRAYGHSVLIQPDGKVVVVGANWLGGSSNDIAIARYLSDGTLDASFGSGGRVTSAMGGWISTCYGALQPDGKILVAGRHGSAFSAMRFLADGSVDGSFGVGGQVSTSIISGSSSESVLAVSIQTDDKILLAGRTAGGDDADMVVVRYLPNGTLDEGFASGGIWVYQVSPLNDQIRAILPQPDGKLVGVGSATIGTWPNTASRFVMVRLNEDGTLDPSFGSNGTALITVSTGQAGTLSGILQPDGKILATGFSEYPTLVTTIRCLSDGTLDQSFGSGGVITTYIASESAVGKDIVLQPDGKILVGAECWEGTGQFYSALLRYSPTGILDGGFGNSGMAITSLSDRSFVPETIALQADGKPLVAGYSFQGQLTDFHITRYLNDLEIAVPEIDPSGTGLHAFPNPVKEQLCVRYALSGADRISLQVIDPTGRIVRALMTNAHRTIGAHLETFDMRGLAPGHYTFALQGSEHVGQVRVIME